jgi:hypothetical protein
MPPRPERNHRKVQASRRLALRRFFLLSAAAAIAFCNLPSGAGAQEPVRRGFENWVAVTAPEGDAYCQPRDYLHTNRKVPDFQLRVVRKKEAEHCRIVLVSAFRFADLTQPVVARVDGNPGIRLDGALEAGTAKRPRTYTTSDAAVVEALLRRMRAGVWIRFDYTDPMGQGNTAVFSLMGVSAALDAIGCRGPGR